MEINYSKDIEYHTQINNKKLPLTSCNSNSMIMALEQAGYDSIIEQGIQSEDFFTTYLTLKEAKD